MGERLLAFREKIPKSNTNTILVVPDLTHEGLILSQIQFESDQWHFEVSVKCGASDLLRLCTTYFKHNNSVDLNGHRSRIEEGDKIELYIKPKQAPKDLDMMICYTYVPSLGTIYNQTSERLVDLKESQFSFLSDISQSVRPTRLHIRCDVPIEEIALTPKFTTTSEVNSELLEYHQKFDAGTDCYDLKLDQPEFAQIIPMLRYYQLEVKVNTTNVDAMIHLLARGFKQ